MPDAPDSWLPTVSARPPGQDSVRVVSWNIERGFRLPKIVEFLRNTRADLMLLQEVDLNARRTHCRDIAAELGRALNLNYAFGMEFQELAEGTPAKPAFHGMATLSRWPLSSARIIRFRHQSGFWKPRWYVPDLAVFQRRLGGRIALVAETAICDRKVVTYNLHLESRGDDAVRLAQLNEVLADCQTHADQPVLIIAGDFNFAAGEGAAGKALDEAGFRDAVRSPGHPTTTSHRVIDWIFVSDRLESAGRVHNEVRASDHYPVSATLAPGCTFAPSLRASSASR